MQAGMGIEEDLENLVFQTLCFRWACHTPRSVITMGHVWGLHQIQCSGFRDQTHQGAHEGDVRVLLWGLGVWGLGFGTRHTRGLTRGYVRGSASGSRVWGVGIGGSDTPGASRGGM